MTVTEEDAHTGMTCTRLCQNAGGQESEVLAHSLRAVYIRPKGGTVSSRRFQSADKETRRQFQPREGLTRQNGSMSTYTQFCYHIVFSTQGRERVLQADEREGLYRYIGGILKNRQCYLYRINGVERSSAYPHHPSSHRLSGA